MARAASTAQPPRLRLRLFARLQTLLLVNALPLSAGIGIAVLYWQGVIGIDMGEGHLLVGVLALLAIGCMVFVGWCLVPVLDWMRRYTVWQCRHGSLIAWALPCLCAWLLWAVGLLAGLLVCLAMVAALSTAAWRVLDPVTESPPEPVAPAAVDEQR